MSLTIKIDYLNIILTDNLSDFSKNYIRLL